MIMIDEKTALAEELNKYIKLEKTQEECTGFIDGFEKALEVVKNLNIDIVSKSLCSDTWCTNEVQSNDTLCNKCRGYKE